MCCLTYNQGFLQPGVLITRVFYNQGFLEQKGVQPGCYKQGFCAIRGSYNQGSHNQGFRQLGVLQPTVLTTSGLTTRGSYNQWS